MIPKMESANRNILKACFSFLICGTIIYIVINSRLATLRTKIIKERFIIDTMGCQLPRTPIFPEYYKSKWYLDKIPNCSYENIFSTLMEDEVIVMNQEYTNSNCCLQEITRVENHDDRYRISTCESLKTVANVSGKEILVAKCGNALNFHVNLPITPQVQTKLDYWKNVPVNELPPSIILIGIDTTSRSQAHRSLPKTMKFMKEIGFTDFKGYHSIAAGTFHNFVAFLMGLQKKQAMANCAPNWESPYDSCPFIWKDFARRNYITMYVEDGHQTFNWGGQGGFRKRPTDYYIHSLFQPIEDLRKNYSSIGQNPVDLECTSNETVPEFVVRYTRRFASKFKDIPFFSFTWLANPFHDNQFTLGTLDEEIHSFFQHLNSLPNFLERTLIIFISDHGSRYSFFDSGSFDAYIERSLPLFLMRIPEGLKNQFPDVEKTLSFNSEALTSGFDVHHTFKHILSLGDKNASASFEPVMADRSSLFLPVDLNRTCATINVYSENCVCGSGTFVEPLKNQFLLPKVMNYVVGRLNKKFSSPKYKNICRTLEAKSDNIIFTQILKKTGNSTDTLIQFKPNSVDAIFEVKVKIYHDEYNFGGCEIIGDFQRVNSYGNQSSCVEIKSDDDKKMREFCLCTEESLKEKLKSASRKLKASKFRKR